MMRTVIAAALAAAVFPLCGAAASAQSVDAPSRAILEQVRKATFGSSLPSISSIHVSGTLVAVGLSSPFEEWDDLRGVRFATRQTGGALAGGSGWDGTQAWSQDYAGLVTIDGGTQGRLFSIGQAYFDNYGYLQPGNGGAVIRSIGKQTDRGTSYDVLEITPPKGSKMDVWIDPSTHLVAELRQKVGLNSSITLLSDYRRVSGVMFPFTNATSTSDGNKFGQKVTDLKFNEEVSARMAVPASNVHDFGIADAGTTTVPIEVINNHLYVHVNVNGKGPYTFILDTGGDWIVTPELAASLNAKTSGSGQIGGVGNATETIGFTHVDSVEIGKATIRNQYMLVLPIATGFGVGEGVKIDGMLGFQAVSRFLTTIDYANSTMTLAMPPAQPAAIPGASATQFYFDGSIPRIPVTVDGVATAAEVDTGSRSGLTLSAPFLADHPQIAAMEKTADGVAGYGVGGPSFAKLGRIGDLQIGPFSLTNTIADFTQQQKGAFADPFNPANIGGGIWRRFTVTFDYAHQQMFLAKNAAFDSPYNHDRSGLFLIDNNGAFTVIDARPGTPGAGAGLHKGDIILSVNGTPASGETLAQLRGALSGPSGTVMHLHVRGTSGERDVTLTLQDYV